MARQAPPSGLVTHGTTVIEAHDQFGVESDTAAPPARQPHHIGILAARRHEFNQSRRAVGGFDLGFEDQRSIAIAARDVRFAIEGG
jgi:hypothetical protein